MDTIFHQQGDCLIKTTSDFPASGKKIKTNVLIEGEHTGHAHRVTSGDFEISQQANMLFLRCVTKCLVTHEEHKKISLPPGDYKIEQVREYDHLNKLERKVID